MEKSQSYVDLLAAEDEVEKILAEMDRALKSTPDRGAAEKIVLIDYASRMGEAQKKSRVAFDKWIQETETLLLEKP